MVESKTCKECGFLTIQGRELSRPERIMLGSHGKSAVMPAHAEQTRCFKKLGDYDLHYAGDSFAGVIEEIERSRDDCPGYMAYEAGFTPAQHQEIQLEQRKAGGVGLREEMKGFRHSDDFRSINKDGREFTLTPNQAHVVQMLFEAWENKTPDLGQAHIIEEVSPDTSTKRLRDLFKTNLAAWKELIETVKKGTFRLKK